MRIYTKAGDGGTTKLGTGSTVSKADIRVEAYGSIDELSSFIGLAVSHLDQADNLRTDLVWIQRKLFQIGTILAFPGENEPIGSVSIATQDIGRLEEAIDRLDEDLPALTSFILPGGIKCAAFLHCARSICRRAERLCSGLDWNEYPLGSHILPFLNRLSDYLFTAARWVNFRAGEGDEKAN